MQSYFDDGENSICFLEELLGENIYAPGWEPLKESFQSVAEKENGKNLMAITEETRLAQKKYNN